MNDPIDDRLELHKCVGDSHENAHTTIVWAVAAILLLLAVWFCAHRQDGAQDGAEKFALACAYERNIGFDHLYVSRHRVGVE